MKKTWVGAGAAVLVTAGLLAAWTTSRTTPGPGAQTAQQASVAVVAAVRQDMARTMTVTAELVPYQEVEVMAKVAGYVQKVLVDVGDRVRQGQTLAILEAPEMKDDLTRAAAAIQRNRAELVRAQDEIRRAESAYNMAHLTYTRLAAVEKSRPGLVAQQEIDDAQSRELMAGAQVASAKSALVVAQEQIRVSEAEQGRSKTMMAYTQVTAPFAGVVTRRYADNGAMIQAGTASQSQAMPVVRLSQNSLLRLVLPVPESAAGLIRVGASLDIRIPTLGKAFQGRVARTTDKVDTASRTMLAEVDVPNPADELMPGMYAEVDLTLASSAQALAVPLTAVKEREGSQVVYVVDADGKVQVRKIAKGLESANHSEVLRGLAEGEHVIVSNSNQLVEGQRVLAVLRKGGE
ncbi:MAG: efflux RND transporter periplasmic adaptor subunit [Bryobacterales bacterium]|nr:efflux RND transporter periplasmic adaptor subunit [Bryobacterales bacterium]